MTSSTLSVDTVGKETFKNPQNITECHTSILSYIKHICEPVNGPRPCMEHYFLKIPYINDKQGKQLQQMQQNVNDKKK
jgi:hypothetical protein